MLTWVSERKKERNENLLCPFYATFNRKKDIENRMYKIFDTRIYLLGFYFGWFQNDYERNGSVSHRRRQSLN